MSVLKVLFLVCVFSLGNMLHAANRSFEIALSDIFVISSGFDDNDNVQIVLDGSFENLCQELGESRFSIKRDERLIEVTQFAQNKDIPDCQNDLQRQSSQNVQWRVPFSKVLDLGELEAGNYKVVFKASSGEKQQRFFSVEVAYTTTADNYFYAPISGLFVPELVFEGSQTSLVLSGIIGTSCFELFENDVQISQTKNTIVILPVMKRIAGENCHAIMRPIHLVLELGNLKTGRYLIHVRSMTGQALNKVFTVTTKDTPIRGN